MKQGLFKTKRVGGVHRQEGTALGDMHIPSPIKECIRGFFGGIDEYKFLDQRFSSREQVDEIQRTPKRQPTNSTSTSTVQQVCYERA